MDRREKLLMDPSLAINQVLILSSGNFYSISELVNSGPKFGIIFQ